MNALDDFLNLASEADAEAVAVERLSLNVQVAIQQSLKAKGLNQKHLARRMGVSDAQVSQWLGSRGSNMTLKTVARIFNALGESDVSLSARDDRGHARHRRSNRELVRLAENLLSHRTPWFEEVSNDNRSPELMVA